ncbi:MAG: hypothetical protein KW804_00490 [Candidatus Doudnabacteria bacterium]|nr:hypothetical protein [Candidatus Doudnabacteria bacterium]
MVLLPVKTKNQGKGGGMISLELTSEQAGLLQNAINGAISDMMPTRRYYQKILKTSYSYSYNPQKDERTEKERAQENLHRQDERISELKQVLLLLTET